MKNDVNFEYSQGNKYTEVQRKEAYALDEAYKVAQELAILINTRLCMFHSERTLRISGNDYQEITMKFASKDGDTCLAQISVPLDFKGNPRIWCDDVNARRVWSTIEKIRASQCSPSVLFNFLSKRFGRITESEWDDIPF
jgi:hypothetical protein